MTNKRIIFTNPDGSVGVIIPTTRALEEYGYTLESIAQKDVPEGLSYKIVDVSEIPTDRTFRNAWKDDGGVKVDMPKAREIQMEKIRKERDEKFKEFDKRYLEAERDGADLKALKEERQVLKDVPQEAQALVDAAQTPEELKAITPLSS